MSHIENRSLDASKMIQKLSNSLAVHTDVAQTQLNVVLGWSKFRAKANKEYERWLAQLNRLIWILTGLSGAVHLTDPLSMDYQNGLPSKPLTFKNKYDKWKEYIKLDCQIAK